MQAIATASWTTVRCPCNRATLGDARGSGGEFRRVCPKCKGWWIIDSETGQTRPDETAEWRRASA
jgi:Zn-finger nucleic acid-binding protein